MHPQVPQQIEEQPCVACVTDAVKRSHGGHCGVEGAGLPDLPGLQLAEECVSAGPGAAERAAAEDHHNRIRAAADRERLVGHCTPHQLLRRLAHGVRSLPPPFPLLIQPCKVSAICDTHMRCMAPHGRLTVLSEECFSALQQVQSQCHLSYSHEIYGTYNGLIIRQNAPGCCLTRPHQVILFSSWYSSKARVYCIRSLLYADKV